MLAFVIFAVCFALALLCTVIYLYPGSSSRSTTVPGPEPLDDLEGNLPDIANFGSLHEFLVDLHETYGPIASFFYGPRLTISMATPELFKQHLTVFDRPPEFYQLLATLQGENSIQFTNGAQGRHRHALYRDCFTQTVITNYYTTFQKLSDDFVKTWNTLASEEHINLRQYMSAYCTKGLTKTMFGSYFDDNQNIFALRQSFDLCWTELESTLAGDRPDQDGDRLKRFDKHKDRLHKMMQSVMDFRQNNRDGGQLFVDSVLESDLAAEERVADMVTMFVGALHPTALLLTWAVYFLASHQEIQDKLHLEVKDTIGDKPVSAQNVSKLKYLQQVLDETLRCSTLSTFAARYQEIAVELGGHKIPANTGVIHALGVSMLSPELYPQPDVFDPDRFSDENSADRPTLGFEPFGFAGKRKCPGHNLSLAQAKVLLPTLLRKFKVELVPGQIVTKVYGIVTAPREDIWVTISHRK